MLKVRENITNQPNDEKQLIKKHPATIPPAY